VFRDGQAKATATSGSLSGRIDTIEAIEHALTLGGLQRAAAVLHLDEGFLPTRGCTH
jgi:hypothetical protein